MNAGKKAGVAKSTAKNRPAEISPARKAVFNVLLAVERGHSHSDDLLRGKAVDALSAPDRNLATALVLGVLRWQILLDHQFQKLLARPNAKLDAEILIALRLGAFQLLRMDRIPARAAIDESVELAKQAGHRFASAMVNAVLRKLAKAEQAAEELEISGEIVGKHPSVAKASIDSVGFMRGLKPPPPSGSSISTACITPARILSEEMEAHPAWMVERWINFYGLEATRAICRHDQSQPALTVRIADAISDKQPPVGVHGLPPFPQKDAERMGHPTLLAELSAAGVVLESGEVLTAARTVVSGDVTATVAFREGRVRIQDEGSQLVAELASENADQKVKSILDCCAAPGGKTLILAERNPTARIMACESSAPRLEQMRKRLASLGNRVECRLADATALTEEAAFDLALADVPCSGTGTLGRNPEIRHRLRMEDLARQAERQRAILTATLRAVRPSGRVVYSTCSLEPEENEQVVAAVLAANPNARLLSLEGRLNGLRDEGILTPEGAERLHASLTPEGCLRLLPGVFRTDGFFVALIERIA
jgi:16S rRNA (cytosine967-C5)-methyltransferase